MKSIFKLAASAFILPLCAFAEPSTLQMEKDIQQLKMQIKNLEQTLLNKKTSVANIVAKKNNELKEQTIATDEAVQYPTFKVGGSLDLDAGYAKKISDNNKSGFAIRALKVNTKGEFMQGLGYNFELDFAGNKVNIKKANISHKFAPNKTATLGKFSDDFGLNYDNKFPEGSILFALRKFTGNGVHFSTFGNNYYTSISAANSHFDNKNNTDDARVVTFRSSFVPILKENNILSAGLSLSYSKPKNLKTEFTYEQNLETKLSENLLNHTEKNIKHQNLTGLDLIYVRGPFTIQGEYIGTKISKKPSQKLYFLGNYIQLSYSLTGENIEYSPTRGGFTGIVPIKPFDLNSKQFGAWEIAFRYSMLKLNSGFSKGGKMKSYSTSLNWYLNNNMNIKFNYITGHTDKNAKVANARPKIYLVKLGMKF